VLVQNLNDVGRNLTRWLIPLPAILFAVFPNQANAEPTPGLATTYYTIDEIPPVQSTTEYPVCGTETENNINRNYDGELFEDCTGDLFMVHMTGYIDIPEHQTIEFMLAHDDGGEITIDGNTFGVWNDQGCSWSMSDELELDAGSQPLELWMYENGGVACLMLAWKIDDEGWAIVPDSAFTTNGVSQTTLTTTSTTTSSTTTTTSTSTTTLPTSTTTTSEPVQTSTTTSVESTTTTTTTTTQPAPTTTQAPYTPPQTTTTNPTIETQPITTITLPETIVVLPETTAPETFITEPDEVILPDITEPETFITYPDGPLEEPVVPVETTILETFFPDYEVGPVLDETEQPEDTIELPEYITETTLLEETDSSPITLPELVADEQVTEVLEEVIEDEPVTDEQVEQILETLTEAAPEQIVEAITQVLAADITSDQATEIASSPEVLAAITETQAEELFEQIVVDELSEEQLEAFTEAIQEAPTEIKQVFEKTIDIFSSKFDEYVPTGSNVPVRTRRTLVVIGSLLTMLPSVHIKTGKL
jgi:hypothetical protein